MTQSKCPACDGYGTRPHRAKQGKFTRCKPCAGRGLISEFTLDPMKPLPIVPWPEPVPMQPIAPPVLPFDPVWPPGITCGGTTVPDRGVRYGS